MVLRSFAFCLRAILSYLHYFLAIRPNFSANPFSARNSSNKWDKGAAGIRVLHLSIALHFNFCGRHRSGCKKRRQARNIPFAGRRRRPFTNLDSFRCCARIKREKGRGRKNGRVGNVRKHCLSGIKIFALEDM